MEVVDLKVWLYEYCQKRGLDPSATGQEHMEPFLNFVLMKLKESGRELHQAIMNPGVLIALVKPKESNNAPVPRKPRKVQKAPAGDM